MNDPRDPSEFRARLWRYVRDPRFAELRFRDSAFEASADFERTAFEIFDALEDRDI